MSLKGLEESEKIAARIQRNLEKSFKQQQRVLKDELAKIEYLLGDPQALLKWRTGLAEAEKVAQLTSMMSDVEQLYLNAGNTKAANIFKERMQKQLQQRLTNLKANDLELSMRVAKQKLNAQQTVIKGMNEIKQDAYLREMYAQSREAGGFLSNFGKAFLDDLVTLETKAAGSKTLGKYMNELYTRYEAGLKDTFISGIIRGDSYEKMEKNLMQTTAVTAGKARLLVRTESNAIFNESVRKVIDDNPLVKGYRFRAVLDSRTSSICQKHDGQYIAKEDVQPGVNYPPLHPNCRSTVTTVLVTEDVKKDTVQRYTKNNQNQWEPVPPGMTYSQYKERFGFSNATHPTSYEPPTTDIHGQQLSFKQPPTYHGYSKASRSAPRKISRLIDSYIDDRQGTKSILNMGLGSDSLAQQAIREAGFDGLPTDLMPDAFDDFISKNELEEYELVFKSEEELEAFKTGEMKGPVEALSREEFLKLPKNKRKHRITVATRSNERVLKPGKDKALIAEKDRRYQQMVAKGIQSDQQVGTAISVEYGYDAAKTSKGVQIFNRTSVIMRTEPAELFKGVEAINVSATDDFILADKKTFDQAYEKFKPKYQDRSDLYSADLYGRRYEETLMKEKGCTSVGRIKHTDEGKSCYRYTGSAHGRMNKEIQRWMNGETSIDDVSLDTAQVVKAVYEAPPLKEPMMVSRGTSMREIRSYLSQTGMKESEDYLQSAQQLIGKEAYINNAAESTSVTEEPAFSSENVWMHIYLPEGTRAISAVQECESSNFDEAELIVGGMQCLRFLGAERTDRLHIYATIVPGKFSPKLFELLKALANR